MNKGMIFSVDAVLALIMVIILAGWLAQQSTTTEENSNVFEEVQMQALDKAAIALYNGIGGADETIDFGTEMGKCFIVYDLDPNNDLGTMATPNKKQVCAER